MSWYNDVILAFPTTSFSTRWRGVAQRLLWRVRRGVESLESRLTRDMSKSQKKGYSRACSALQRIFDETQLEIAETDETIERLAQQGRVADRDYFIGKRAGLIKVRDKIKEELGYDPKRTGD